VRQLILLICAIAVLVFLGRFAINRYFGAMDEIRFSAPPLPPIRFLPNTVLLVWRPGKDEQATFRLRHDETLQERLADLGCRWEIRPYSTVTDPELNPGRERNPLLLAAAAEPTVELPFVLGYQRGLDSPWMIVPTDITADELIKYVRTPQRQKPMSPR
jgi:hypothetical protein